MLAPLRAAFARAKRSPAVRFGVPLVLFVAGGAAVLAQFLGGVMHKRDARVVRRSERAVKLEEAHADIVGRLKMHDRELVLKPIHRPKEDA